MGGIKPPPTVYKEQRSTIELHNLQANAPDPGTSIVDLF